MVKKAAMVDYDKLNQDYQVSTGSPFLFLNSEPKSTHNITLTHSQLVIIPSLCLILLK